MSDAFEWQALQAFLFGEERLQYEEEHLTPSLSENVVAKKVQQICLKGP